MNADFIMNAIEMFWALLRLDGVSHFIYSVKEGSGPFGIDTSIEGLKSQEVSVGIFYFLIASIIVFTIFVFMYMLKSKSSLKRGEKILFVWILLGVIVAVIFGASQMLHGYLF
jgi:uncharacterized membrane protein